MNRTLHITQGTHLTSILKQFHIEGKIVTWQGMLCEGKTLTNVGSELFWKTRFDFFNKRYKVKKEMFVEYALKQYRTLCNEKKQDEIVLWFDNNLSSQINMIALLNWLKNHRKHIQITLVSGGKEVWKDFCSTPNALSKETLLQRYKNRTSLTIDDIEYADYIWQLYCGDNPIRLENFSKINASQFQYLSDSIKIHLSRFPGARNGLNKLENAILNILSPEQESISREALLCTLMRKENIYGYTCLQHDKILSTMQSLFHSDDGIKINPKGEAIRNNTQNHYAVMKNDDIYFGGSKKYGFLYLHASEKLLKL